jgi:hypothetical protein
LNQLRVLLLFITTNVIAIRMGITDEWGSCLGNTGEDSLRSGLAWTNDDGIIESHEKNRLSEQRACQRGALPSSSRVLLCDSPEFFFAVERGPLLTYA